MLKLRKGVAMDDLKKIGFKRSPGGLSYYKLTDEYEVFIQRFNGDDYKKNCVYVEIKDYSMILTDLDIFYELIKADLVEVV